MAREINLYNKICQEKGEKFKLVGKYSVPKCLSDQFPS